MQTRKISISFIVALLIIIMMGSPEIAQGALLVFCDESSFLSYLGTYKMVSFEDEIIGPHPSPYSVFTSDTYDEQLTIVHHRNQK